MPKVTIIIPVYNVEKYIHQSVNSALAQTLKDIEIILIDDQSPDNCPQICDEYAKMDSRVIVVHQRNRGLGGARNAGLDIAKGDYILFLDSDDWIALECCEQMYNTALKYQTDIVLSGEVLYLEDQDRFSPGYRHYRAQIMQNITHETYIKCFTPAWGRLYKKSFIDKYHLRFVEKCLYEDNSWGCLIAGLTEKVSYAGNFFYYRQRSGSITSNVDERVLDWVRDFKYFQKILKKVPLPKQKLIWAYEWYLLNFYNYFKKCSPNLQWRFFHFISDNFQPVNLSEKDLLKNAIFNDKNGEILEFYRKIKKKELHSYCLDFKLFGCIPLISFIAKEKEI